MNVEMRPNPKGKVSLPFILLAAGVFTLLVFIIALRPSGFDQLKDYVYSLFGWVEIEEVTAEEFNSDYQQLAARYENLSTKEIPIADKTDVEAHSLLYQIHFDDDPSVMIFDLRSTEDYAAGHLNGAFTLPFTIIQSGNFSLPIDTDLVFYGGDTPIDSQILIEKLNAQGIFEITLITEPYATWSSQFDQETGNPLAIDPDD